jgi:hypothetical protein
MRPVKTAATTGSWVAIWLRLATVVLGLKNSSSHCFIAALVTS